ncbi:MAG: hypothetical protein ACLP0A_06030 [Verrucomicrobiia bacterium]
MRNKWYSDNRDLVKWSVLLLLAEGCGADRIIQIAYYKESPFQELEIDGHQHEIPSEVLSHFRDIRRIKALASRPRIEVFDNLFSNRNLYLEAVKGFITSFTSERCVVFLDPDTGLEPPGNPSLAHVLNREVRFIWDVLPPNWVMVFYQHRTNRNKQPWIDAKHKQFAQAIGRPQREVKLAYGKKIAGDVVFFFASKPETTAEGDAL